MCFRLLACFLALVLSGCGSTIHHEFSIDSVPATSLSVDAKQRMVYVTDKARVRTKDGELAAVSRVLCAEPSPEAIVGVSSALRADAAVGEKTLGVGQSLAEAVAQLGVRTPVIQLLRDGLYRACEAYMNGVIDESEYQQILSHYDVTMVVLLAIEGLSSCTYANAATGGNASAGTTKAGNGTTAAIEKVESGKGKQGEVAADASATSSTRTCQISASSATAATDIMKEFLAYKAVLHFRACMGETLKAAIAKGYQPGLDAMNLARQVCESGATAVTAARKP